MTKKAIELAIFAYPNTLRQKRPRPEKSSRAFIETVMTSSSNVLPEAAITKSSAPSSVLNT